MFSSFAPAIQAAKPTLVTCGRIMAYNAAKAGGVTLGIVGGISVTVGVVRVTDAASRGVTRLADATWRTSSRAVRRLRNRRAKPAPTVEIRKDPAEKGPAPVIDADFDAAKAA